MKILIADHDWIVRDGIARLITDILPSADIVQAADRTALQSILSTRPGLAVAILDEALVDSNEEILFAEIRKIAPGAAIGLLATSIDREHMLKAIYFGAVAIILKDEGREQVTQALALLLAGQVAFPRHILARGPAETPAAPPQVFDKRETEDNLTPREREVIGLIGQGQTVAKIATALVLSPHTVRVHVTRIMKKLDLRDRPALMHYAVIRAQAARRTGETAH